MAEKKKNPYLRVEYRVMSLGGRDGDSRFIADTEKECEDWIEKIPADLMGSVTFTIQKVYTTSTPRKKQ